ncbi:hypothetical protein UFOVP29_296 [uncultured Caudovirales phage]|uniref:Uncharacterized protein n=1 Tax=uncultured Caudovirales phage TaxID=2100421 RepID=A0A6J5KQN8_9CAUD|nr:hypothetical protein UFOVP29_296 [uncultured Caudovirales phage]
MQEHIPGQITGHVLITDFLTQEVLADTHNAINWENFSLSLANVLANEPRGWIQDMVFGNGGATVSGTGVISYRPPNIIGQSAALYNQTYSKVVNDKDKNQLDTDTTKNLTHVNHVVGTYYSDVMVTCVLDLGEPDGQEAFDTATDFTSDYVFNELGLRAFSELGPDIKTSGPGLLLTHAVFSPIQKSLNRQIQIVYTLRLQTA